MGATFAYFSLTSTAESGTAKTDITGQTGTPGEKLAQIILEGDKDNLYLKLDAAKMAQSLTASSAVDYYANATEEEEVGSTAKNHTVAKISLSQGVEGTSYKCTSKFSITASGTLIDLGSEKVKAGDGKIILNTTPESKVTVNGESTAQSHTLLDLINAPEHKIEDTVVFTLTGTTDETALKADFVITNTQISQNDLADKALKIVIQNEDLVCDTVAGE